MLHETGHWAARGALLLGLALGTVAVAAATAPLAADQLAMNGNYQAAAAAFAKAHAAAPQDAAIAAKLAQAWLLAGGHNKQAVAAAEQATELAPHVARYQLLLGTALTAYVNDVSVFRKLGIAHRIRDAFKAAAQVDPADAKAHASLAMYYLVAPGIAGGDKAKGEAELAIVARQDPSGADQLRANVALNNQDYDAAEGWFGKAVTAAKDSAALMALAAYYNYRKQPAKALETYRKAIAAYPDAAVAHYQIGRLAALGEGDPDAGITALTRYLDHVPDWQHGDPPHDWTHLRLGQVYVRKGEVAKARAEYQRALALNPALDEARQALAKLGAG